MRGLGNKGGQIALITVGVLAVVGIGLFIFSLFGGQPTVDPVQPAANGSINPSKRLIVVGTTSAPMKNLRVTVDGKDVTAQVRGASDGIALDMPKLANGPHTMAVSYSTGGTVGGGTASQSWNFTVDRTPPKLAVTKPAGDGFNAHTVPVAGTATGNSAIRITWKGDGLAGAQATGPKGRGPPAPPCPRAHQSSASPPLTRPATPPPRRSGCTSTPSRPPYS